MLPARAATAVTADLTMAHLLIAQNALARAGEALGRARASNKGGYVESALAKVNLASADLKKAQDFLQAHSEAGTLAAGPTLPETSMVLPVIVPNHGGSGGNPQMEAAIRALNEALAEVQKTPVGAKGGLRDIVMEDIGQANADVVAGINFAASTGRGAGSLATTGVIIISNPPVATPQGPRPTLAPNAHPTAEERLTAAQAALEKTLTQLQAPASGKVNEIAMQGVALTKAMADAELALKDIAAGLAYLKEHPEANTLPMGPMPADTVVVYLAPIPAYLDRNQLGRFTNPGIIDALDALNDAQRELTNNLPGGAPGHVLDDLGGNRDKIITGIALVSADIVAGLDSTYNHYQQINISRGGIGD